MREQTKETSLLSSKRKQRFPLHRYSSSEINRHQNLGVNDKILNGSFNSNLSFNFANVQPKLRISQPGDIYEQEADKVAEQVMHEPYYDHLFKCRGITRQNQEGQNNLNLVTAFHLFPEEITTDIRDGGQPLDTRTRDFMESKFGFDFSNVRIHTDENSIKSAEMLDANAFTLGSHIVFNKDKFAPSSIYGQKLLSHELVHVIQQNGTAHRNVNTQNNMVERSILSTSPITGAIRSFTQPIIARQSGPRVGGGGKVLADNSVLSQLHLRGGTRAQEMGLTGWIHTIETGMGEFIKGHGQEAWKIIQKKFNIEVVPDPSKGVLAAQKRRAQGAGMGMGEEWYSSNDAKYSAASYERKIPLATGDEKLAARAERLGVVTKLSVSTQPTVRGGPRGNPPPTSLRRPRTGAGGGRGAVFGFALNLLASWAHEKAVQNRIEEQAKKVGWVSTESMLEPSGEGIFYDIAAFFMDPTKSTETSVDLRDRFNMQVWRANMRKKANEKKLMESWTIEWELFHPPKRPGMEPESETRTVTYRKEPPDGRWVVVSGNPSRFTNLNDIISNKVSDSILEIAIFGYPGVI